MKKTVGIFVIETGVLAHKFTPKHDTQSSRFGFFSLKLFWFGFLFFDPETGVFALRCLYVSRFFRGSKFQMFFRLHKSNGWDRWWKKEYCRLSP